MTTPARDEALRDRVVGVLRENVCGLIADMGDLADALLGVLADSRAEAWDEGVREARRMGEGIPSWFLDALAARNPYRKEATNG